MVAPFGREPELKKAEVEAEFWSRIGFPTVESRSWPRSPPEVRDSFCRSSERARSVSPPPVVAAKGVLLRAASTSPVDMRLSRKPVLTPWKGPLPRRRTTPAPMLGKFLDHAITRSIGNSAIAAERSPPTSMTA